MKQKWGLVKWCLAVAVIVWAASGSSVAQAAGKAIRFDCGTRDSAVMAGYKALAGADVYDESTGYGWEGVAPESVVFPRGVLADDRGRTWYPPFIDENVNDLTRDGVVSEQDVVFRADVPDGTYRVTVTVGDRSRALGSIDVWMNGKVVGERVTPWAPGSYRLLLKTPGGSSRHVRGTVVVTDGVIRVKLTKNQTYYDKKMAEQSKLPTPYSQWHHKKPVITEPPYDYIGWPFVHNSLMGIEILPHTPAPVVGENDKLELTQPIASGALNEAIAKFNEEDFEGALRALARVREPGAQVAKAIVQLWLAGRLEVEREKTLVPVALKVLRKHAASHLRDNGVAELVQDAEIFQRALTMHVNRGALGTNHSIENDKAIGWWWLINEGSPLYHKAQLYSARAAHMLLPYIPTLGVEYTILKELEKKFPDNRYVKYLLYYEWEPYGDGTHPDDWYVEDHASKAKGAPEWVRELQPAWVTLVDWSEWWIKFKQQPDGNIGGGWGDDVEIVAAFGYMEYVSPGISGMLIEGTRKLVEGMWNLSEVDAEIGYCLPMADAEHTAEWTGNTLGVMVQIDYGNPTWIERSMKTAKLMRDLWTARNKNGERHFRANIFGAAQVGRGDQSNDSFINYRAVRPATAVLDYNGNPAISRVFVELADGWLAAAMSTDRGKPRGVIPAQVSFPDGILGGMNSPNWYTASHPPGTVNYDWVEGKELEQRYKSYIQDLLMTAYNQTRDAKYLEPFKLEYELAARYGNKPELTTGARLQRIPGDPVGGQEAASAAGGEEALAPAVQGSERWVGEKLDLVEYWLVAERILKGRTGKLENDISKQDVIRVSSYVNKTTKMRWPLTTTEASATDRAAFVGIMNPFFIYTGGSFGGALLKAAVTYENTTKDFAAAVMGEDPQGLRILYHSLTPQVRKVGIVPWYLEPSATYRLRYGPDTNEDEVMDSITENRKFFFPQVGTPVYVTVEPRVTYVIEIDQLERGKVPGPAPDPGLSAMDIRYEELRYGGIILAKVHNVGALPAENVQVAFYEGDPDAGGTPLGTALIPNIEAPNDLEPRAVTVGVNWAPKDGPREIYVVVDPDDEIEGEITTFNNMAHRLLPVEEKEEEPAPVKKPATGSFRGGR